MQTDAGGRARDVAVLGAGSWGTALAIALARNGHRVRLWGHRTAHVEALAKTRSNDRYLPGIAFPENLAPTGAMAKSVAGVTVIVLAVPSHVYALTLRQLRPYLESDMRVAWATKGLDPDSSRLLHQVTTDVLGEAFAGAVLSGPSFAREVAIGLPTAVTVAALDPESATAIAGIFHGGNLRIYTTSDIVGVELGGAVKNVLAIAAGISDGLGFGANARAALITRGLAEMVRLGRAIGGRPETLMGLAGLGDLVLTCTDDQSRNRRFGLALGRGESALVAANALGQVVEGTAAAAEIVRLAHRHEIEMPITEQVNAVVHSGTDPRQAVEALLARDPRAEHE